MAEKRTIGLSLSEDEIAELDAIGAESRTAALRLLLAEHAAALAAGPVAPCPDGGASVQPQGETVQPVEPVAAVGIDAEIARCLAYGAEPASLIAAHIVRRLCPTQQHRLVWWQRLNALCRVA